MTDDFDPAMVKRLASEAWASLIKRAPHPLAAMLVATSEVEPEHTKLVFSEVMRAALRALPLSAAALNALEAGEATVVPADQVAHESSCARHDMPAYPNGRCDCAASPYTEKKDG